ncbi:hypothetical protein EDD18DRAFT_1108340 [Armillaria luteobubalina]|uniref:DUF6535 domain-containing protein n=1 Tax=Armillaria luteobubalina TaxID=153913 RepID=A0AA39PYV5_9AGAR|nr:hypothetical protein EDD18DRAFT_1108340 [Armillaria luteobubalina]
MTVLLGFLAKFFHVIYQLQSAIFMWFTSNDPYNYKDKYPEDEIYEETGPNGKVWRTHVDKSMNHDVRMVVELKDSVNMLLVFAGLFSVVVTTFVAQTSQSLQADYAQVLASLLFEMVLIQHAIVNDVWVNSLWFTSLSLSLATALIAVLTKQWFHHYLALPSGLPQE